MSLEITFSIKLQKLSENVSSATMQTTITDVIKLCVKKYKTAGNFQAKLYFIIIEAFCYLVTQAL